MANTSTQNSSNASFYKRHGRRSSFLCHPIGLELLKKYASLKENGIDKIVGKALANSLATNLQPVVRKNETEIASRLIHVIEKEWSQSQKDYSSVLRESAEIVEGRLFQLQVKGKPDDDVRMTLVLPDGKGLTVQLIIEVSVNGNGGRKKIGQACDYASLINGQRQTTLLFTFHIDNELKTDGNESKSNGDESVGVRNDSNSDSGCGKYLKITQEAFIYLHSESEKERKMGFLWREVYEKPDAQTDLEFLQQSCEGLVRCLDWASHNRDAEHPSEWLLVSKNVAICMEQVFKVFDNRFHLT